MVVQKTEFLRRVTCVVLLISLFVLTSCKTERPSPTEPSTDVQLFGFVRAGGSPVSGATVSIGEHTASSDATGLYRLTGIPGGRQTVTVKKAGFQDFTKTINLERTAANQLDADLVPTGGTGVISGDVRADNSPLGGVTITVGGSSTTTAADGTFTLNGLSPGSLTLTAHKDGFNDAQLLVNVGDVVHIVLTRPNVSPASLTGTVTSGGSPVDGASVSAQGQIAITGTDGKYSFATLIAGSTAIRVTKTGFTTFQQNVTLVSGANTLNISLAAAGTASLTGTVSSASGAVSGATVSVQGKTATTASDGTYTITGLASGATTVAVSKTGFTTASQTTTLNTGSNTFNVTLIASSSGTTTLSGLVTISTGGALAGATVSLQGKTATTGNDGKYAFSDLVSGPATVSFSKIGFQGQSKQVTLTAGSNTLDAALVPTSPRASLSGTVTFNGNGVAGAVVSAQGLSVVTGSDGTYQFGDLSTGSTTVTTQKDGFQDARLTVSLSAGANSLDIPLSPSSGTALLSGTVTNGTSSAVSGVVVTVQGKSATSATDGSYLITGLVPGSAVVTAVESGFQNFQKSVTLNSGSNSLDIALVSATTTNAFLDGLVTTADGTPIPGVKVAAQNLTTITDDNGQYRIDNLTSGSTIVTATRTGFQDFRQTVVLTVGDNALAIQMTPTSGTAVLSGTVVTGTAPVSGVTVTVQGTGVVSDSAGRYLFTNLTPGTSVITATRTGFQNFQQSISIVGGQNTVNINLTPSSTTLSGFVRKADGTGIGGARVTVQSISATADSSGLYRITGLTPGTVTVTSTATGFKNFTTTTVLTAGDNTLDIQMTP